MKLWFKIALTLLVLALGIGSVAIVNSLKAKPELLPPARAATAVETMQISLSPLQVTLQAQGMVEPRTVSRLSSEVSGLILKVSPELIPGGQFKQGDVLFEIDPSDYQSALANAESQLAQAELNLTKEETSAAQAKKDWERLGSSQNPSPLVLRVPQLQAARASVKASAAQVDQARRNLERTLIKAPFDGRIRQKLHDLGARVMPGDPLLEIYSTERWILRLPIPLNDLAAIDLQKNQEIDVYSPTDPERKWKATFLHFDGEVDRTNRSVWLVLEIPNQVQAHENPIPGEYLHAVIPGITLPNAVRLPRGAIYGTHTVLVVTPDSKIQRRDVEIARTEPKSVLITKGLNPGENVCLTSLSVVIEGMEVTPTHSVSTPLEPAH